MPLYQYECETCGERSEAVRSVSESGKPIRCTCGEMAARAFWKPPRLIRKTGIPYRRNYTAAYDIGAGRVFDSWEQEYRYQCENGLQPLTNKQAEEGMHRCLTNDRPMPSKKQFKKDWMDADRAAQKDLAKARKISIS